GTLLDDELREEDLDLAALEVPGGDRRQLGAQLVTDARAGQVVDRLALEQRCDGVTQHHLGATEPGLIGRVLDLEGNRGDEVIAPPRARRVHDHAIETEDQRRGRSTTVLATRLLLRDLRLARTGERRSDELPTQAEPDDECGNDGDQPLWTCTLGGRGFAGGRLGLFHPWILRIADVVSHQSQEATAVPPRSGAVTLYHIRTWSIVAQTGLVPGFEPDRQVLPPGTALLAGGKSRTAPRVIATPPTKRTSHASAAEIHQLVEHLVGGGDHPGAGLEAALGHDHRGELLREIHVGILEGTRRDGGRVRAAGEAQDRQARVGRLGVHVVTAPEQAGRVVEARQGELGQRLAHAVREHAGDD